MSCFATTENTSRNNERGSTSDTEILSVNDMSGSIAGLIR